MLPPPPLLPTEERSLRHWYVCIHAHTHAHTHYRPTYMFFNLLFILESTIGLSWPVFIAIQQNYIIHDLTLRTIMSGTILYGLSISSSTTISLHLPWTILSFNEKHFHFRSRASSPGESSRRFWSSDNIRRSLTPLKISTIVNINCNWQTSQMSPLMSAQTHSKLYLWGR